MPEGLSDGGWIGSFSDGGDALFDFPDIGEVLIHSAAVGGSKGGHRLSAYRRGTDRECFCDTERAGRAPAGKGWDRQCRRAARKRSADLLRPAAANRDLSTTGCWCRRSSSRCRSCPPCGNPRSRSAEKRRGLSQPQSAPQPDRRWCRRGRPHPRCIWRRAGKETAGQLWRGRRRCAFLAAWLARPEIKVMSSRKGSSGLRMRVNAKSDPADSRRPVLHDDAVGNINDCQAARLLGRKRKGREHGVEHRQRDGCARASQQCAAVKVFRGQEIHGVVCRAASFARALHLERQAVHDSSKPARKTIIVRRRVGFNGFYAWDGHSAPGPGPAHRSASFR